MILLISPVIRILASSRAHAHMLISVYHARRQTISNRPRHEDLEVGKVDRETRLYVTQGTRLVSLRQQPAPICIEAASSYCRRHLLLYLPTRLVERLSGHPPRRLSLPGTSPHRIDTGVWTLSHQGLQLCTPPQLHVSTDALSI